MCTVVILRRPGHDWPLILAANRDEMTGRPWLPPARHWSERAEVIAGQDGLLHISEMADYRVEKVEDICKEGDKVTVKVIDIDDRGRIRLSRRAALEEIHEESTAEA